MTGSVLLACLMRFCIRGPLEAWDDGRRLALGGPQQRVLLGVLLLNANRVVSADRLVDCLWGERPPANARSLAQGCVAGLRRVLRTVDGTTTRQPLCTRAPGYLLEARPGELDLDQFDELTAAGRAVMDGSPSGLEHAAELLNEALSLWRGPALQDVAVEAFQAEVARLEERRLAVLEERIELDLRRGRHAGLIGELQALVRESPLRERLWAQLMLALHRADRQADALAAYQRLRQTLVEELGVEPGATVQRLHHAILSGVEPIDASGTRPGTGLATAASGRAVPAQLPAAVAGFTGRAQHLKLLDELLSGADREMTIGAISGAAGVGKTALAVHWAHQVRDQFGGGQLYVDLRGHAPVAPMRPIEALAGFLHALGVPGEQVPVDLDNAAALFRTLVADRRVLVVLDNARSAEQVRPLLPASPGCLVLVTSRNRLGGLVAHDGAVHYVLDVLTPDEAHALLCQLLGHRVRDERQAAEQLARSCALLPLALRIAAAHLLLHPGRGIAEQVAELAAGNRLGAMEVDGDELSAIRATFDLSYNAVELEACRLFRQLGLVPGPDVTVDAAAALAATTADRAAPLLDRLARAPGRTECVRQVHLPRSPAPLRRRTRVPGGRRAGPQGGHRPTARLVRQHGRRRCSAALSGEGAAAGAIGRRWRGDDVR